MFPFRFKPRNKRAYRVEPLGQESWKSVKHWPSLLRLYIPLKAYNGKQVTFNGNLMVR